MKAPPKNFKERSPEEIKAYLAKKLRKARKDAGISQAEVARILNVHRPTISEIEAGRRNVIVQELVVFARLYGMKISDLVERE